MRVLTDFFVNTKLYFEENKSVSLREYFSDWTLWEKWWITIATVLITVASVLTWDTTNQQASWLSLVSSISGIWCVLLTAKKRISNYIIGFVNVIFYAWAAYSWKLYGDFMLNVFYFLPMQFVGWHYWVKPESKINKDVVYGKKMTASSLLTMLFSTATAVIFYAMFLDYLDGNTPVLDSMSTVFSIVAMILMAKRYFEQWVLWVIVDVVSTIMWLNVCLNEGGMMNLGLAIMWMLWTVNAIYGWLKWRKV
jgi:nicotinamide mononucleotide transporter